MMVNKDWSRDLNDLSSWRLQNPWETAALVAEEVATKWRHGLLRRHGLSWRRSPWRRRKPKGNRLRWPRSPRQRSQQPGCSLARCPPTALARIRTRCGTRSLPADGGCGKWTRGRSERLVECRPLWKLVVQGVDSDLTQMEKMLNQTRVSKAKQRRQDDPNLIFRDIKKEAPKPCQTLMHARPK